MKIGIDGRWRSPVPVSQHDLEVVSQRYRPDDEFACIFIDEQDPFVLRIQVDVEASDLGDALTVGRSELATAAATADLGGFAESVYASDDEQYIVWSSDDAR
jgi:hypothetical protein